MKKQKAIIDFTRVRDNDLTETATLIHEKLNANPDFPTPSPTLPVFLTAIEDYSNALVKAKDGTKQDTADKNAKRKILEGMMADLGNYVNTIADGDLVKLEGSGFPLSKVPAPVGVLEQPSIFRVGEGIDPGTVKIEIGLVPRATGYIVLYYEVRSDGTVPGSDAEWQSKLFSKTTGLITGLKSGKKYVFKSAATSPEANTINLYNFTEPVEKFVQ